MRKNAKKSKFNKHPWKELGMMTPSRTTVINNTGVVVAALSGMAAFVFAADAFTTWFLRLL